MNPRAAIGALCACLTLSACSSPTILLQCPAIPKSILAPCHPPDREIATNGDLAMAFVEARACLREEWLKLAAVAEMAECRRE
jgi:hypothetical protein